MVVLAACGEDPARPPVLPADARVQIASRALELNVGASQPLNATLVTANGQPITDFTLSFATDTGGPLEVTSTGAVTGRRAGAGRVRISAANRVLDSVDVDVFGRPEGVADGTPALAGRPYGVAISRQGVGYVARLDAGAVTIANTAARTIGGTVTVGNTPTGVAFNPAGTFAYVTNQLSSSVGVIDVAAGTQVSTITLPANPFVIAVSPNGQRVYASTNAGKVYVIDATARTVIDSVETGFAPNSIAVARDGSRYWVANAFSGTVTEVTATTNDVARQITVGGTPHEVVVTRDGSRLYVANEAGRVDVVTLATGALGTPIPVTGSPFGMALSPDQSRLYVALLDAGRVRVIDTSSLTPIGLIEVGAAPRRIAFDYFGTRALVTSESGSVTFIR